MAVDLTNFTEAWRCNEVTNGNNLLGVSGETIAAVGSVGAATDGFIEDPSTDTRCRGWMAPIGDAAPLYFARNFAAGDIFDVRGLTSCTIAMWYKLRSTNNGSPYGFSIHNPGVAAGQAIWLFSNHYTIGANPSPAFCMLDGTNNNTFKLVQANDALSAPEDDVTWQFNAGGYDAATNRIFHFWGRGPGESYYTETSGYTAGFAYSGTGSKIGLGQYIADLGSIHEQKIDQVMWWKGYALTEEDLNFLWNNHEGRALDDLTAAAPLDPVTSNISNLTRIPLRTSVGLIPRGQEGILHDTQPAVYRTGLELETSAPVSATVLYRLIRETDDR